MIHPLGSRQWQVVLKQDPNKPKMSFQLSAPQWVVPDAQTPEQTGELSALLNSEDVEFSGLCFLPPCHLDVQLPQPMGAQHPEQLLCSFFCILPREGRTNA